jgi:hypothetical protein
MVVSLRDSSLQMKPTMRMTAEICKTFKKHADISA